MAKNDVGMKRNKNLRGVNLQRCKIHEAFMNRRCTECGAAVAAQQTTKQYSVLAECVLAKPSLQNRPKIVGPGSRMANLSEKSDFFFRGVVLVV